jgi:DNA polymerase (family X)
VIDSTSITIGRAWDILDQVLPAISNACPDIESLTPAGGLRRVEATIATIVVVAVTDDVNRTVAAIASSSVLSAPRIEEGTVTGKSRNASVELRVVDRGSYGSALFEATGSPEHVAEIRRRGLAAQPFHTEDALYASVGLEYIEPELRGDTGEVEAAATATLPALVARSNMRGDLHMHTSYSDGRDPLDVMVAGAHALGYEYIAITDHSEGAAASRTLARADIERQRDEIEALRERFPGMTILHGIEVDILRDGRLDFEDAVLEQFDIVLASLHDRANHAPRRLTERSLAALRHPLVNILCHPANQLVGVSAGYALDFAALFETAATTGTALEVDGAPSHMDLDGARARAAAQAGVTLSIDSDCHRVEALARQMALGVGTARRGWVGPQQVLNTRPLAEIRSFVAAKRRGRPA